MSVDSFFVSFLCEKDHKNFVRVNDKLVCLEALLCGFWIQRIINHSYEQESRCAWVVWSKYLSAYCLFSISLTFA